MITPSLLLALAACTPPLCGDATGPVLFVDRVQDPGQLGGSEPAVFATITAALTHARSGSTVCVAPGTWREQLLLHRDDVHLVGAGTDLTLLRPPPAALAAPAEPVVTLVARGLSLRDLRVEGGPVGVHVGPDAEVVLSDVVLRENDIGLEVLDPLQLKASDLVLEANRDVGALMTGESALAVQLERLRVQDNGDPTRSEAGGLDSELPLRLVDALFLRNAGTYTTDLAARGGLDAEDLDVVGSPAVGGVVRALVEGPVRISGATIEASGGPALSADCEGRDLWVDNLAVATTSGPWPSQAVILTDCSGRLAHATLAQLDGGVGETGLVLRGFGDLGLANTVITGFDTPLATGSWWGMLRPEVVLTGPLEQAALLHPSPSSPDLRPASDSPLIDAGVPVEVREDRDGRARPQGLGPDVGAFERH